ncbi:2-amino-4-hydroxy-6-hydroxymethyldihydropteridine diphosphokinase [Dyadobacter sandarakinus]|uniref:2-amino-4-hydroxy-6-hydroxymethyldihydropteridine pyrophosphokinase n=1 Tax=Dyadobacter sandarakinus TaxID=2747268 RepID=A0ABX7IAM9_9BACT|nr:2-amino-4-hydroxy-6-hydroxymethyldihydropteridine diphosphokinase [Dyadobacter sandarakinus]QRR02999.1 2-amino-4-hydroxy-6-hydroxymethyldihydropteridine diphosphokinase [Dyadobacter sandarakinus]
MINTTVHNAFLLLGSNLGDRAEVLHAARELIAGRVGRITVTSSIYETAPWGLLDQPAFLNQVLRVETACEAEDVLRIILEIEHELGRVREQRWGARLIDIDLLYLDDIVKDSAPLTLPHPRLHERRFTLVPLAEIAPAFLHPLLKQTSAQLLSACADDSVVVLFS